MSGPPTAVIAGGGLAGIAAACELADSGFRVTLLEKRPFLGGRAYSHTDKSTGWEVDNGQHVFLGCCTEFIGFLERLGVRDGVHLQKRFRVPVIDKVRGASELKAVNLAPPLHLGPSLLAFKPLSPIEKAQATLAFFAIQVLDRAKHPELDDISFEDWLRAHGQGAHAIHALWNLIVLPTLNDDVSRVSADLALMVFQEGFLRSRTGANIGWAQAGLSRLIAAGARRYIEERGGTVRLGARVDQVDMPEGRIAQFHVGGESIRADAYVLALPVEEVPDVLPRSLLGEKFFARIERLETSPIVNVHLWYDRPVWNEEFASFLSTPIQWIFNKTRLWKHGGRGQYLDISLSGARDFIDMPSNEILQLFTKEMWALVPGTRGAELSRALVVKQRDATFAPRPGSRKLRPAQETPVPNLFLAGDWTATGWPATMESAVRSGYLAARAMLHRRSGAPKKVIAA